MLTINYDIDIIKYLIKIIVSKLLYPSLNTSRYHLTIIYVIRYTGE